MVRVWLLFFGQTNHVLKARNNHAYALHMNTDTKQCSVNAIFMPIRANLQKNLLNKFYKFCCVCVCVSLHLNWKVIHFSHRMRKKTAKVNQMCMYCVMNLIMRFESEISACTHKKYKDLYIKCNELNVVWWIESVITNKICISFSVELFTYNNKNTARAKHTHTHKLTHTSNQLNLSHEMKTKVPPQATATVINKHMLCPLSYFLSQMFELTFEILISFED